MLSQYLTSIVKGSPFTLATNEIDSYDAVYQEMLHEGIAPLFYPLMQNKSQLPADFVNKIRQQYENALIYKDFCRQKLINLLPDFPQEGRVVLIQGFSLCESLYHEPLIRSMSDIDIYLPDKTIEDVRAVLAQNGFFPFQTYRNVWTYKNGFQIDLHEDLWGCERVPGRVFFKPDFPVKLLPSTAIPGYYILAPPYDLLHSIFHGLKHAFNRKKWLVDMLLFYHAGYFPLLQDIDQNGLYAIALTRLASEGLLEEQYLSGKYLRPFSRNRIIQKLTIRYGNRTGIGEVALALACSSFSKSIRYLWSSFFLSPIVLKDMYGKYPYVLLIVIRIWTVFTKLFTRKNETENY